MCGAELIQNDLQLEAAKKALKACEANGVLCPPVASCLAAAAGDLPLLKAAASQSSALQAYEIKYLAAAGALALTFHICPHAC